MVDERLRDLERRFRETGEVGDEARWLAQRVASGGLAREVLEGAAWLGHEAAAIAAGIEPVRPVRDRSAVLAKLLDPRPDETDAEARRRELEERAERNRERGERGLWLPQVARALGDEDGATLEAAPFIQGDALLALIREVSFVAEDGLGDTPGSAPPGWAFHRDVLEPAGPTSAEWSGVTLRERFASIESLSWERDDAERAALLPFNGNPAYVVPFGWARARLERLFEMRPVSLILERLDGRAGVSVSQSSEWRWMLDEERGEEERIPTVVITTATWSDGHALDQGESAS